MFSSRFNQNKYYSNSEKMRKIAKESMDKYIRSLDEKYKKHQQVSLIKKCNCTCTCNNKKDDSKVATMIGILPFVIFGWGVYQLSKNIFYK